MVERRLKLLVEALAGEQWPKLWVKVGIGERMTWQRWTLAPWGIGHQPERGVVRSRWMCQMIDDLPWSCARWCTCSGYPHT